MDRHKVIVEYAATIQPYASAARKLRTEIEALNTSIAKSRAVSAVAMQSVTADFNANLQGMRNWSTQSIAMDSAAVRLGKSIERNHLTMARQKDLLKEYRQGAVGARGAISELAKEQVRMSRSQVNFYNDQNGQRRAMVSTPQGINFQSQATQVAVARQEMQIYNRVLAQNAEATVNWGKNTQWAGRQIMVGMTVPLLMMGAAAKNVFMDVDQELTRMGKVYGATITGTSQATIDNIKQQVAGLGTSLATDWGVSMKETIGLAADVAATGKEGEDLLISTREAMRLSVLGEVDRQEALKATLSLQSAFKLSNAELVESVNLLNAVENQTSTSLEDLSIAIPKAGPVVQALGGDVGDLATMLVSMKEGGIAAAEGANAIKSGLASLINPTKRAQEASKALGIDLVGIVEANKGELMPTMLQFQKALMGLDSFSRAKLIEKIFGKYQFARISALFENLNREGSQSIQAMQLNGASAVELASIADKELTALTDSTSARWKRAVEGFKAQIVPAGEVITKVFTAVLNAVNGLLGAFNNLPDPIKNVVGSLIGITALVGPLLMIAGIFGNFLGQVMKGFAFMRGKKFGVFDMLTTDMVAANAATNELVNAQFNEKQSLLEINTVMERQIALLEQLAAGHMEAANASNTAAQRMTPPVAPRDRLPGGPPTEGTGGAYVASRMTRNNAEAERRASDTADRRAMAQDPRLAKAYIDEATGATKGGKPQTPEQQAAAATANALARTGTLVQAATPVGMQLGDSLAEAIKGGLKNADIPDFVEQEVLRLTNDPVLAERAKLIEKAKAGVPLTDDEQARMDKFGEKMSKPDRKTGGRKRHTSGLTITAAAVLAAGGKVEALGGLEGSHMNPDSEGGSRINVGTTPEASDPNRVRGANPMEAARREWLIRQNPDLYGADTMALAMALDDEKAMTDMGTAAGSPAVKENIGKASGKKNTRTQGKEEELLRAKKAEGIATEAEIARINELADARRSATLEGERQIESAQELARKKFKALQDEADARGVTWEQVLSEQSDATVAALAGEGELREVREDGVKRVMTEEEKAGKAAVKAAKEQVKTVNEASKAQYAQQKAYEAAQRTATTSARTAKGAVTRAGNVPGVSIDVRGINAAIASGTAEGMRTALTGVKAQLIAAQTAGDAVAERALQSAADKIQAAANALKDQEVTIKPSPEEKALLADQKKAAADQLVAAKAQLASAERNAGSSGVYAAGAAQEVVGAQREEGVVAREEKVVGQEAQIARTDQASTESFARSVGVMASIAGVPAAAPPGSGVPIRKIDANHPDYDAALEENKKRGAGDKPTKGQRMSNFLGRADGGTMAVGGAAMGIGMLTGNDTAMKFGNIAMALGMVAAAGPPLVGAFMMLQRAATRASLALSANVGKAGGIGGMLKGAAASFVGMINPVTVGLVAVAGLATIAYMAWKKEKERREAAERGGESTSEWTGVTLSDRNALTEPKDTGAKGSEYTQKRDALVESEAYKAVSSDIDKQRNDEEKVAYLRRKYDANVRVIKQKYQGEEQKKRLTELNDIFKIISNEKGLADKWREAKKEGRNSAKELIENYQDAQANPDALKYRPGRRRPGTTGGLKGARGEIQEAREELKLLENDLAIGFKEAVLAGAGDLPTIISGIIPIAEEWRQISLSGSGNFQDMKAKMKEGLPDFLHDEIDNANTMDAAILAIINSMGAIPKDITVQMNLVQNERGIGVWGADETDEEFEARKAKAYMDYVVNIAAAEKSRGEITTAMNKKVSSSFDSEAAGAAYDKRIEGIEAADKAADKAHKASQDRYKEQQDALKDQIDGKQKEIDAIQKVIEQIDKQAEAQHKALDAAKQIDDFQRNRDKSNINYYDAIARGDHVGAANIRAEQQQADADQQYDQAGESIDKAADAKKKPQEARIEAVNKEIEALNARIDAIGKVAEKADKAYEKEKERRQEALEAIRKNKDAHLAASKAAADAEAARQNKARSDALATFNSEMTNINNLAANNKLTVGQVETRTKAAYDGISKYMGWDAAETATAATQMANTLIKAYGDALKGVGVDPKVKGKPIKYYDQEGNLTSVRFPGGGRTLATSHTGDYISPDHTTGSGGNKSDEVTRTLQVGEYVVRKEAVKKYGRDNIHAINKMQAPKMHTGGPVGGSAMRVASGITMAGLDQMEGVAFGEIAKHFKDNIIPQAMQQNFGVGPGVPTVGGGGANWGGIDVAGASPTAKAAMGRAMADFTNLVGMCLQEVRGWYGIGAKYPSAAEAWRGAKNKHADSNPKLGAPVFWTGGNDGFGHIAMYMGKGLVRSTDQPTGRVNNVPMGKFGGKLSYAGWSEDLNGRAISLRKGATIKKDNVLTNLHARETVLTADLSSSLKRGINGLSAVPAIIGGSGVGGGDVFNEGTRNINLNVYATPGMDVDDLADSMASRLERAERRVSG